ncbi:MAG: protein kinase domain-containing protein, partial [Gemmatimonadaceae bacterium]
MKIRSSEQWQLIDSIFGGALALPEDERSSYLDESCGGDARLRAEVERLLSASEAAGDFLEVLDAGQAARLLEDSADADGSIGRYKIIQKLGEGGMGVVYLAEDASLKRQVAVKLLPPWIDASSGANRRLLEEARAASAIDHPNIATVHEIGETDDGRLFITMGYYEGGTLRDRIERGKMSVDAALGVTLQAATGLSAAHRRGIVHRDIKPENLLLTSEGLVKIADFGLAKVGESSSTAGKAIGTAAYMSPEQSAAAEVDARTDLWSLGVVLYEMLAGERPFPGEKKKAILDSIRSDSPDLGGRIEHGVPVGVRAIVERCLQKEPAARYQSADELIHDLEALPGRNSLRRRTLVLGVAAIVIIAVAGIAGGWQSSRPSGPGGATPQGVSSLAVLPFADLSPASDHEYLSDGITEELIHALGRIESLRVVARSSAFQFKGQDIDVREAGARLGVDHVLEGSV